MEGQESYERMTRYVPDPTWRWWKYPTTKFLIGLIEVQIFWDVLRLWRSSIFVFRNRRCILHI